MNALELLKQDHERVTQLFEVMRGMNDYASKERLFRQIKDELEVHTYLEETVFYPAVAELKSLRRTILESYEQLRHVRTLLREIEYLEDGSEGFETKLAAMKEYVEHYIKHVETELFPRSESAMAPEYLERLGNDMEQKKRCVKGTAFDASSA